MAADRAIVVRIPSNLRVTLKRSAKKNERTLSAEVRDTLTRTYAPAQGQQARHEEHPCGGSNGNA